MKRFAWVLPFLVASVLQSSLLWAHCDTYEGPVIKAAEKALESGNVNLVLIWVPRKSEAGIKAAFKKARESGQSEPFFQELVKVHREGEGVKYAGIKPRGTPVAPEIAAADQSILEGKLDPVLPFVEPGHRKHLEHAFSKVMKQKNYNPDDVDAGRKYVDAYVKFVHLVEGQHGH